MSVAQAKALACSSGDSTFTNSSHALARLLMFTSFDGCLKSKLIESMDPKAFYTCSSTKLTSTNESTTATGDSNHGNTGERERESGATDHYTIINRTKVIILHAQKP